MTGAEEAAIIVPSPEADFAAGAMQLVRLTTPPGPQFFLHLKQVDKKEPGTRDAFHVFTMLLPS